MNPDLPPRSPPPTVAPNTYPPGGQTTAGAQPPKGGVLGTAAEAVQAEQQRLRDVLSLLPAYVVLLTADYHVPFANRFFEERFGKSNGKRCYEYLFNRTTPCEFCETYKVLKTNSPLRWEWTGPDGRNYDIHDFPFTDVDGSPLIMEVGIDITERKLAEAALAKHRDHLEELVKERTAELRASEQRYRALFERMTEGFALHEIITDEHGQPCDYRFLEVNPAFERLTGLKPGAVAGKRVREVLPLTELAWIRNYGQVALTGEPMHFEDFSSALNRWYGVFAYRPAPTQFAVIFTDITARKQAEAEIRRHAEDLRARNEELTRFNEAMVGRELRMIELKQEVNALCAQAGQPPRYGPEAKEQVRPPE